MLRICGYTCTLNCIVGSEMLTLDYCVLAEMYNGIILICRLGYDGKLKRVCTYCKCQCLDAELDGKPVTVSLCGKLYICYFLFTSFCIGSL